MFIKALWYFSFAHGKQNTWITVLSIEILWISVNSVNTLSSIVCLTEISDNQGLLSCLNMTGSIWGQSLCGVPFKDTSQSHEEWCRWLSQISWHRDFRDVPPRTFPKNLSPLKSPTHSSCINICLSYLGVSSWPCCPYTHLFFSSVQSMPPVGHLWASSLNSESEIYLFRIFSLGIPLTTPFSFSEYGQHYFQQPLRALPGSPRLRSSKSLLQA